MRRIVLIIIAATMSVAGLAYGADFAHKEIFLNNTALTKDWCNGSGNGAGYKCDLTGGIYRGVNASNRRMKHVNFDGADLLPTKATPPVNMSFKGAKLQNSRFYNATLKGVDFSRSTAGAANLRRAVFAKARLTDVNFSDANLRQANFTDATLVNVNFCGAILTGAIELKTIKGHCCDSRTRLHNGLAPTIPNDCVRCVGRGSCQ